LDTALGVHKVGVTVTVSVIGATMGVDVVATIWVFEASAVIVPASSSADKPVEVSCGTACVDSPPGRLQLTIASQMARIDESILLLSMISPLDLLSVEPKVRSIALWSDWVACNRITSSFLL
jgi:hypothetical protein